jgi:hypothetical protein
MKTLEDYLKELDEILKLTGITNDKAISLAKDFITKCVDYESLEYDLDKEKDLLNIEVSRSGENEILIYREHLKNFYNILIDEDGDICYLLIPKEREKIEIVHFKDDETIDDVFKKFIIN